MTYVDAAEASPRKNGQIKLHGPADFEAMRKAGRLTAEALDLCADKIRPGVTTQAIDNLMFEFAMDNNAYPAPLDYRGYRKAICTSINHVVCHGIPDNKPMRDGDIVNIDVTLIVDGWHGDSSRMFYVGEVPRRAQRLVEVTYESLMRGIAAVKPATPLATSAMPFRPMSRPTVCRSCAISAVTASASSFMTSRTSCISAAPVRDHTSRRACS